MNAAPFDPKIRFDCLTDHRATLGESPVYDQIRNCLWWVDITGMALLRTDLHDGSTDRWQTPEQIGFVVLTDKSGVIVGMETGLFLFDPKTGGFDLRAALPSRGIRFNDATTDAEGRLWAGTMDIDNRRPVGKLYRIDASFGMTEVLSGLTTINGLAVDDDLGRLYVSDSSPDVQMVWVMDIDLPTGKSVQDGFSQICVPMPVGQTVRRWTPPATTGWPGSMPASSMFSRVTVRMYQKSEPPSTALPNRHLSGRISRRSASRRRVARRLMELFSSPLDCRFRDAVCCLSVSRDPDADQQR